MTRTETIESGTRSPRELLGESAAGAVQGASGRRLRVRFVITSLPVGGAETLLVNLVTRMDRTAFEPGVICLKEAGELGTRVSAEVPLVQGLLASKWDVRVLSRLTRLLRSERVDAVVTVGAGDKMFWGRLAAWRAGVPVICAALHSTGWPDSVGWLNRQLTSITDGFIACAADHARYLAVRENFPPERVFMIPNGVDTERFRPNHARRPALRDALGIPRESQVVGIVAALRPEKNHGQFIRAAADVSRRYPAAHFVVVGDGPSRVEVEAAVAEQGIESRVHLLGGRDDVDQILPGLDAFCLTSRNEAKPVSILEALSCGVPVVAPDVGSISETVLPEVTGLLTTPLSTASTADALVRLLEDREGAARMGMEGRRRVRGAWSLGSMVSGYENLIESLYNAKAVHWGREPWRRATKCPAESAPNSEGARAEFHEVSPALEETWSELPAYSLEPETTTN